MTVELPPWTPFSADSVPALPYFGEDRGGVVTIVASKGVGRTHEAGDLLLTAVRRWAHWGERVVVMDIGLDNPTLHVNLGLPNSEGVSDALLFGSSLERVAQPVSGGAGFFFVPAGMPVADPGSVVAAGRWARLCEGFRDAGVVLALFVSEEESTRVQAVAHADRAIVICLPGEDAGEVLGRTDIPTLAVFGPEVSGGPVEVIESEAAVPAATVEEPERSVADPVVETPVEATAEEADRYISLEEALSMSAASLVDEGTAVESDRVVEEDATVDPAPVVEEETVFGAGPASDAEPVAEARPGVTPEPDTFFGIGAAAGSDLSEEEAFLGGALEIDLPDEGMANIWAVETESDDFFTELDTAALGPDEPSSEAEPTAEVVEEPAVVTSAAEPLVAEPEGETVDTPDESAAWSAGAAPSAVSDGGTSEKAVGDVAEDAPLEQFDTAFLADLMADLAGDSDAEPDDPSMEASDSAPEEEEALPSDMLDTFRSAAAEDIQSLLLGQSGSSEDEEDLLSDPLGASHEGGDDALFDPLAADPIDLVPDAGVSAPAGGPQREVAAESAEGVRIVGSPDIHEDMEVFVTSSRPAPVVRTVPNYTRALLLLLLLVLVSAGYMGYVEIPWITSGVDMHDIFPEAFDEEAGSAADAASAGAPVTPAARVRYTSPVVPYTVTLGAIRDVDQVESFVADVRERVPEVLFYVVPVEVSGILYHRVMAGAEGDEAGAAALADRLAEALGREVDDMLVRSTPLAFRIGELPDVETARARAASIEAAGVPGYVLAVDVSDGRTLFRVYAGAFEKEPDATYLQNQLAQRGLGMAVLTQRTGRLPE